MRTCSRPQLTTDPMNEDDIRKSGAGSAALAYVRGLGDYLAALDLGARTLQRRLGADRQRYLDLVDSTRRAQAAHYLYDSDIDLSELALLPGFPEQSALQRTFRRWYDGTPHALCRRSGAGETHAVR